MARWKTYVPLILVAVAAGATIAYFASKGPVAPVKRVNCAPYLAQVYGFEGELANVTMVVKDSIDKDPVQGINLYLFEDKPYYWDKVNRHSNIATELSSATPVGTSDQYGKLVFTVNVPYVDEKTKAYYGVLAGSGYWTDLYEVDVGFSTALSAPSQDQCVALFKKTDITARDLIDVKLKLVDESVKAERGGTVKLSNVLVDKIGTWDAPSAVSLGVNADEVAKEINKAINVYVNDGYGRIDAIEFKRLIDDLSSEGIKRIEVEVSSAGKVLFKKVLYDEYDSDTPLAKDDSETLNEINGKDLLVLKPNTGFTITLKVVADTEATATQGSGRLGPGEQFLQIVLKQPHPQETSPVTITVQG